MIKILKILGITMALMSNTFAYCLNKSCDPSIKYAMGKQRDSLKHRLNDLLGALTNNNRATEDQTLIITYETKSYMRLKERVKIETILLDQASFYSHKSQEIADLIKRVYLINQTKQGE